jgi:hypothetical protein
LIPATHDKVIPIALPRQRRVVKDANPTAQLAAVATAAEDPDTEQQSGDAEKEDASVVLSDTEWAEMHGIVDAGHDVHSAELLPLPDLESVLERIPPGLIEALRDRLKAEFRGVVRPPCKR